MANQDLIKVYKKVLSSFKFAEPTSFSERFAQERFFKKYQEFDPEVQDQLADECWQAWLETDRSLPEIGTKLLPPEWYKARLHLHGVCRSFKAGAIRFPKGSEFESTRGFNSLESRLCASSWTCTYENFEAFSKLCYNHKALKRAALRRYSYWFKRNFPTTHERTANRTLFEGFKQRGDGGRVGFHIFAWKLRKVVSMQRGSRFSTVPKNNENRRPINVECFANTIVQSTIGEGIKELLSKHYKVQLDKVPDMHRIRISDLSIATIDLKNASDSVSWDLCCFLLPKSMLDQLDNARSQMVLGPDGDYHMIRKVSSMGNGFTFELMTLILTTICRVLDPDSSVFGDDIIIDQKMAPRLIQLLEAVGFVVNKEKSFIQGPFRESCGGNYYEGEGYVESFDFKEPETVHDCMVICNKAYALRQYQSFRMLYNTLIRISPKSMQGPCLRLTAETGDFGRPVVNFPPYFINNGKLKGVKVEKESIRKALKNLCYEPNRFIMVKGLKYVPDERTPCHKHLKPRNWAKYEMYLHAGRRSKDIVTNRGRWKEIMFVASAETMFQVSALRT